MEINFNYEGNTIPIKFKSNESIKEIYNNFCIKLSLNIKSLYFLYNGKIIDEKLTLDKVINSEDKKRNKMNILVFSMKDKYPNENNSQVKAEQIICPKCEENAKIKIVNYMLKIYGCKNNHLTENILLNQFEKTQLIDESKIICNFCKKTSKDNFKKEFSFCGTCKRNLCPICKDSHDKEHIIINYNLKNYTCPEHGDSYNSYCDDCKKNICIACEEEHSGHHLESFGKMLPKKDELKNKINELKININKFREQIKEIKKVLNYVMDNMENYFKIIEDEYNSFDLKKRNYEILSNINENYNDKIINDIQEIINEENISIKFYKINNIYNQMKNDIQKNLTNNFNFDFFNNPILTIPKIPNNMDSGVNILLKEFNDLKEDSFTFGVVWDLGFNLWLKDNNPFEWIFTLNGLPYTPYFGGKFYLKAIFPYDFPESKPEFRFITPFYHINVNNTCNYGEKIDPLGHICIAKVNCWRPGIKIKDIIIDISTYFWGASTQNPLSLDMNNLFKNNIELFRKRAEYFTKKYANPKLPYKELDAWDFSCPDELK